MKLLFLTVLSLLVACTTVTSTGISSEKAAAISKVSIDPYTLGDLDEEFKKDKDVVMTAIKQDPRLLTSAHKTLLRQNKEIVLYAVSRIGILVVDLERDNPMLNDPDIILAAARDNYAGAVGSASTALKNDPKFVRQAMAIDALTLCFVDARFRQDKKLIKLFKKQYPNRNC